MSKLILSLNDRYAAITVAAALLTDASLSPELSPENVDKLQYLRDALLEMQTEIGTQLNLLKYEQSTTEGSREMQTEIGTQINLGKTMEVADESTTASKIILSE